MRPGAKHTRMLSLMVLVIIQAPMLLGQHATGSGFRISMGPMQGFGLPRLASMWPSLTALHSSLRHSSARGQGGGGGGITITSTLDLFRSSDLHNQQALLHIRIEVITTLGYSCQLFRLASENYTLQPTSCKARSTARQSLSM